METGKKPLVVGMDKYKTASGLAFYRTKASAGTTASPKEMPAYNTSGRHHFGKNSLMYRYWFPESEKKNRDMILVAGNRRKFQGIDTSVDAGGSGEINEIPLTKNGKSAGLMFYSIIREDRKMSAPARPSDKLIVRADRPLETSMKGEKNENTSSLPGLSL